MFKPEAPLELVYSQAARMLTTLPPSSQLAWAKRLHDPYCHHAERRVRDGLMEDRGGARDGLPGDAEPAPRRAGAGRGEGSPSRRDAAPGGHLHPPGAAADPQRGQPAVLVQDAAAVVRDAAGPAGAGEGRRPGVPGRRPAPAGGDGPAAGEERRGPLLPRRHAQLRRLRLGWLPRLLPAHRRRCLPEADRCHGRPRAELEVPRGCEAVG